MLDPNCGTHWNFTNDMKTIETYDKQHLRNFNATHGPTKASTPRINHKGMPQVQPANSFASLSKKWYCFDLN